MDNAREIQLIGDSDGVFIFVFNRAELHRNNWLDFHDSNNNTCQHIGMDPPAMG